MRISVCESRGYWAFGVWSLDGKNPDRATDKAETDVSSPIQRTAPEVPSL